MNALILGGITLGLLSRGAVVAAAGTAHIREPDGERCEGCGMERASSPIAAFDARPYRARLPVCGFIDARLAWLDPDLWNQLPPWAPAAYVALPSSSCIDLVLIARLRRRVMVKGTCPLSDTTAKR